MVRKQKLSAFRLAEFGPEGPSLRSRGLDDRSSAGWITLLRN